MNQKQAIVLTGFMGSGKSAVGRMIARRLDRPFYDLDKVIEEGEDRVIAEIFRTDGEARFRKLELAYLKKVLNNRPMVLALGGGALQQEAVLQLVRDNGLTIFLDVPEQTLVQRLKKDKKRPLLRDSEGNLHGDDELEEKIRNLLQKRMPLYRTADITIRVSPRWTVFETTDMLIRKLNEYAPDSTT